MHKDNRPTHSGQLPQASHSSVIAALIEQPTTQGMSCDALRMVMGIRLLAVCNRVGHDPLLELIHRLGHIEAAKRFMAFADNVGEAWPEPVRVMRPCCHIASPDEFTVAALANAARKGNRVRFEMTLAGFIEAEHFETLFDSAVRAVTAFD